MLRLTLPLGAILAASAVPASAGDSWDLANRTYLEGAQMGLTAGTTSDQLACGAYWTVWSLILLGSDFSEEEQSELVPPLRADTALIMARAYIPDFDAVPQEQNTEVEGYFEEASAMFDAYLDGDEEAGGTFFAMLGVCHPRAGGEAE